MYTPSDRIEILLRAAGREERHGNPSTGQALRRMAADARPLQPTGGSSRSREGSYDRSGRRNRVSTDAGHASWAHD